MHSYSTYIVGSYKPDLRNFRYALDRLDEDFDISPDQVIVVANSKFHDISPYVDPFLFLFLFLFLFFFLPYYNFHVHGPPCEIQADTSLLLPLVRSRLRRT